MLDFFLSTFYQTEIIPPQKRNKTHLEGLTGGSAQLFRLSANVKVEDTQIGWISTDLCMWVEALKHNC